MLFTTLFRRSVMGSRLTRRADRTTPRPGCLLRLEALEDRTLPAVGLLFDTPSGILALHGSARDNTLREAVNPAGFLELTLDGQVHSSDPASAAFDPGLAGATRATLTGLRYDGPGGDATLILGPQQLAGGLRVSATGVRVLAEDMTAAGPVEIAAPAITVRGNLRGSSLALNSPGLVTVEPAGSLAS